MLIVFHFYGKMFDVPKLFLCDRMTVQSSIYCYLLSHFFAKLMCNFASLTSWVVPVQFWVTVTHISNILGYTIKHLYYMKPLNDFETAIEFYTLFLFFHSSEIFFLSLSNVYKQWFDEQCLLYWYYIYIIITKYKMSYITIYSLPKSS